jgi:endonuclease/exonuclease/phosphatase family metal-dependent hydrolase
MFNKKPAPQPSAPRSLWARVAGMLARFLFLINLLSLVPLLLALIAPYVNPAGWFWPAFAAILKPWLVLVPVLWLVGWLVKRRWKYLLANALALVLAWNTLPLTYQFGGELAAKPKDIRVLTFNVGAFGYQYTKFEQVLKWLKTAKAEVVCLQEFYDIRPRGAGSTDERKRAVQRLKTELGLPHAQFVELLTGTRYGMVILSKFPIVEGGAVTETGRKVKNGAMFADVRVFGQVVRVYNVHLQSYNFSLAQRRLLDTETGHEEARESDTSLRQPTQQSTWKLMKTMIGAWRTQSEQVTKLLAHRSNWPGPAVLCGDFNNLPYSYYYRQLVDGMRDSFRERGAGFGRTYSKGSLLPMRIDYVFASPDFVVADHAVLRPTLPLSDHFPVLVSLRFGFHN